MPYLALNDSQISVSVDEQVPAFEKRLALELKPETQGVLIQALENLIERPSSELRLELPQGWTVFWKLRSGESRMLLAHPDLNTWVGTIALSELDLRAWISELRNMTQTSLPTTLSRIVTFGAFSNLDIEVRLS